MLPEVFYFAAYVCVLDEKIYDECYFKIMSFIEKETNSTEITNELLKILGDTEDKISLETIIENLKNATAEDKNMALALGLDIALADDYWAEDENLFFTKACKELNYPEDKFAELFSKVKIAADQEVEKDVESSKKLYGRTFYQLMATIAPKGLKDQFNQRYANCLLSGTDYSNAIKEMRKISTEDLIYAKEALTHISETMKNFLSDLDTSKKKVSTLSEKLNKKQDTQDVTKCLENIKSQVTDFITQTKEQVSVSLKEKEIAAKYYTISFMGRTKAGKSTLHSVILGGINKEFIGVGKERTTRFNRIYKWNGIRIIDTPGIGAPGGKSDTEIAKSVIDESDLICYVVTSDSIQETEFAFLKELKAQNKPIIVLLNKKENLDHPIHKKRFLENPLYWYERTDNDAIEGHLIRIKEYAEKYYNNSYFDIFPVQLRAAQLALTEEDVAIKHKLEKGARLKYFKDNLQIQILENGKIKRSQTMLNGTIFSIGKYKNTFNNQIKELEAIKENLKKQSKVSLSKIKKSSTATIASLEKGLNSIYDDFIQTNIRNFTNENFGLKHDVLDYNWKKYYKQSGFESRISDRIEREFSAYKNEVESIIQEFSENLTFAFEHLEIKYDIKGTFDTKNFMTIIGSLTCFAGSILLLALGLSNPVGLIVVGVGTGVSLIANFFKSKDKKIKEAQDKLYESIKNAFNESCSSNIEKIILDLKKTISNTEFNINKLFTSLISELELLISNLKPLMKECNHYESLLNKLYAIRILNFAKQYKDEFNINDEQLLSQLKVEHDFAKQIKIKTNLIKHLDTERIKNVLQEDIILETL